MRTDHELSEAWRSGDQGAGSELFERHFDAVFRFFRNKVSQGAEDLVQQTFLACVQTREGFRGDCSFRTYLFTIARSKLYSHYRGRGHGGEALDGGITSCADLGISPSGFVVGQEDQRLLLAALRMLPIEMQVALELRYFEELRGPELARILEVPEGTVRSRLRRGLQLLQERLVELGADPVGVESTISDLESWSRRIRDEVLGSRG